MHSFPSDQLVIKLLSRIWGIAISFLLYRLICIKITFLYNPRKILPNFMRYLNVKINKKSVNLLSSLSHLKISSLIWGLKSFFRGKMAILGKFNALKNGEEKILFCLYLNLKTKNRSKLQKKKGCLQ